MGESDLAALIRSCQRGDRTALAELVRQFERRVYAYLARLAPAVAEDASQETFVRVFRALPRYRHQGRFEAWLYRLATSALIDALRGRQRAATGLDTAALTGEAAEPLDAAAAAEERRNLGRALAELPFEQRQVVALRTHAGLTFREIAEALDCPLGTALARMHRAVESLRRALGRRGEP